MTRESKAAARSRDLALERGRRITRSVAVSSAVAVVVFGFISSTHVLASQTSSSSSTPDQSQQTTSPEYGGDDGYGSYFNSSPDQSSQDPSNQSQDQSNLQAPSGFGAGSSGSAQAVTGAS